MRRCILHTLTRIFLKYLDSEAADLLEEGRIHFNRFDLQNRNIVPQGDKTVLFLWTSDRILNTMYVLLSQRGHQVTTSGMTLEVRNCGPEELFDELQQIADLEPPEPAQLAASVENKIIDKHDRYLTEELLNANYASKQLDVEGALKTVKAIVGKTDRNPDKSY